MQPLLPARLLVLSRGLRWREILTTSPLHAPRRSLSENPVDVDEVTELADGAVVVDDVVAAVEADGTIEVVEVVEVVEADGTVEVVEVVAEEIPAESTEA